ncbi:MAG: dTDP-4-dehydrorhamnose 3,5-epimerase [Pseudomonadota bacterium]
MQVEDTAIPGAKILTPRRFGDARGYFSETWNARRMAEAGLELTFVQDNESLSVDVGTIRGLHYQAPPFAQAKLVRAVTGTIRDVIIDVRIGSPAYGTQVAVTLSEENDQQLLVPRGCLHGFATLTPNTRVSYKVDNWYDGPSDGSVRWNDPALAIDWGIEEENAVVSDKDAAAPLFNDWTSPFRWEETA